MTYTEWKQKYINNKANTSTKSNSNDTINNKKIEETNEVLKRLKKSKIEYNLVQKLTKDLTNEEIIQKVSGGDKTKGSCSSVSFAYIANKNGLDVLDFRGGASQDFFSTISNIYEIAKLPGVKSNIEENFNDIMGTMNLLKTVEDGKEYYLATGNHAAIIKKNEKCYQYLELQSPKENGFKPLTSESLKKRFGCKQSHSVAGYKLKTKNILIDIDSLKGNSEFQEILGYINTLGTEQMRGVDGNEK